MGKTRSKFITFIVVFSMLMSMGVSFGADLSSDGLQLEGEEFTEGLVTPTDSAIEYSAVEEPEVFEYRVNYYVDGTTDFVPGIEVNPLTGEAPEGLLDLPEHPFVEGYSLSEDQPTQIEVTSDGPNEVDIYYVEEVSIIIPMAVGDPSLTYYADSDILSVEGESTNGQTEVRRIWMDDGTLYIGVIGFLKDIVGVKYNGVVVNNYVIDSAEDEKVPLTITTKSDNAVHVITVNDPVPPKKSGAFWIVVSFNLDEQKLTSPFTIGVDTDATGGFGLVDIEVDILNGYIVNYYIDGTTNRVPGIEPNPYLGYSTIIGTVDLQPHPTTDDYIVKPGSPTTIKLTGKNDSINIYYISNEAEISIEHYLESDGSYPADPNHSETDDALIGSTVYDHDYENYYFGWTYEPDNDDSATVEADGSTVLRLYYTENEKIAVSVTANSGTKAYNGLEQTVSDYEDPEGLLTGHELSGITASGSGTNVGNYSVTFTGTPKIMDGEVDVTDNYDINLVPGNLEIIPAEIAVSVTVNSDTKVYTGSEQTVTGYEKPVGLLTGHELSGISASGSGTNVGDYSVTFAGTPVIMDGIVDVTENYVIDWDPGNLEITPKGLTITADDKSKMYGESDPELTATISGFVDGEDISDLQGQLNFTREEGEAVGIYDITPSGLSSNNYNITFEKGQLTIMSADSIVLEVSGFEGVYDGKYHGVSVTNESDFESVEYSTDKDTWSVSILEFRDVGIYTVYVKATNDNFDDSYASADVVIKPRPITITASSSSRTFNGQPLTNGNYSITSGSIAENDELLDVTVTGTQTSVGSSANVPSDAVITSFSEVDANDNYKITYVDGTLTVTSSGSSGGGGTTTTRDDDEEINEPLPLAPIQPQPELPVVVEEEPIIIPEEPEMVEFEEPAPLAAPAPTLPKAGSVGAGEMAGFGALLMAIGILLGKKKGF